MPTKSFNTPDETKTLPKTRLDIVNIAGVRLVRNTFDPGWKWSEDVKPTAGTDSCQAHHLLCVVSGQLKAVMDDGTELEARAGQVADIPSGHDAWVVGDEAVVAIDIAGALH